MNFEGFLDSYRYIGDVSQAWAGVNPAFSGNPDWVAQARKSLQHRLLEGETRVRRRHFISELTLFASELQSRIRPPFLLPFNRKLLDLTWILTWRRRR